MTASPIKPISEELLLMEEHKKLNFKNSECETLKLASRQGTYQEKESYFRFCFQMVFGKLWQD
jgi:hypothetical protein